MLKTFALSELIYLFTVLPNPTEETMKEITNYMPFYWIKIEKMKRNVISQDYRHGGLKMIDIPKYITSIES